MRRIFRTIGLLALVGCGGDSSGPAASVVGTWILQTINGQSLPHTVGPAGNRVEILSDMYVMRASGDYTETFVVREAGGSTARTTSGSVSGTWEQNNATITLNSTDGIALTAVITGDLVRANVNGDVFVLGRQ